MRFYSFQIVIEKEQEDDGYFAYSPNLPGCFGKGETIEKAKWSIREAMQLHLASLLENGDPIPQFPSVVHVEELSIGLPA
ncbi:MAG: type II toxin-antitoxin system HicB family antitoxin [Candidatus Sumerlaeia bacterium]|nr:type II toxin-antitoxin system HicB family antitoxin [Candidatus Sumerlaeia bacterium]